MWFIYSIDLYAWGFYSHKFQTFCNILAVFCLRVILRLLGTGSAQLWWSGGLLVQFHTDHAVTLQWPKRISTGVMSVKCQDQYLHTEIPLWLNTPLGSWAVADASILVLARVDTREALGDEEKCPGQGIFKEKNNPELVQNLEAKTWAPCVVPGHATL